MFIGIDVGGTKVEGIVFDKGKIVAEGSHDFLVNNSSIYKNLYEKQIIT